MAFRLRIVQTDWQPAKHNCDNMCYVSEHVANVSKVGTCVSFRQMLSIFEQIIRFRPLSIPDGFAVASPITITMGNVPMSPAVASPARRTELVRNDAPCPIPDTKNAHACAPTTHAARRSLKPHHHHRGHP